MKYGKMWSVSLLDNFKFHHHICIIPNFWWVVSKNNPIYNNNNGISILCFFMSVCQTSGLLNTNTNLLISSLVSLICLLPVNPNSDAPKGLSLEHEPLDSMLCIYIGLIWKKTPYSIFDNAPNKVVGCIIQKRYTFVNGPLCMYDYNDNFFSNQTYINSFFKSAEKCSWVASLCIILSLFLLFYKLCVLKNIFI